jgi:hypothetical protein
MIKKFYVLAWFLLIGSVIASVFSGTLTELAMVTFGLIALSLVHALAVWAVLIDPRDAQPQ